MGNLLQVSPGLATDYFRLFVNRRAYTIQSNRPHPRSGKHYYYRPTRNKLGPTLETIRRHLEGEITIGLYAINPSLAGRSCSCHAFVPLVVAGGATPRKPDSPLHSGVVRRKLTVGQESKKEIPDEEAG